MRALGISIEDVEQEFGFPIGWTKISEGKILNDFLEEQGITVEEFKIKEDTFRLDSLKKHCPNTGMYCLFEEYLGTDTLLQIHSSVQNAMHY